ncbi:MAG: hypothetical protein E7578_05910 [Ruminococcaceae bacterium]|nr:hypothetical protein [Oscillospiraceae bacterium]
MIAVMCSSIAFANNSNSISIYGYDTQEYLNFYNEIKDIEFAGDGSIYVTMHHDVSDVGKVYTDTNFPELDIETIEDLTGANPNDTKDDYGEEFRNVLKITLTNKSDQNVISAIEKLQERADEDILKPCFDGSYN